MDKSRLAFFTGTSEACASTLRRLQRSGENVFDTTKEWLTKGECRYKYVIFDTDQWVGYDELNIWEIRGVDEWYLKKLEHYEI